MSVNSLDSIDRFDAALMNSRSVREIYKYMGVPDNAPYGDLFNQSAIDYGCFDTSDLAVWLRNPQPCTWLGLLYFPGGPHRPVQTMRANEHTEKPSRSLSQE